MQLSDWKAATTERGKKGALLCGTLALFLAGTVLPAAAQQASQAIQLRAVIELFTSQGCASCPPADNLIRRYARDNSIIVLTLPVTCWDYLGWRDTLAKDHFTIRQRIYAKIRGSRSIYTPQAVINGTAHMVGSDETAIGGALETTTTSALPVKVDITSTGETFRIAVAASNTRERATILLAPFYRERSVSVDDGENAGKRLTYTNVVSGLLPIGQLPSSSPSAEAFVINLPRASALPDNTDGFAILVQSGNPDRPGQVIGAASYMQNTSPARTRHSPNL